MLWKQNKTNKKQPLRAVFSVLNSIELMFDYYLIQDVYFDFDKYIEKVEINLDKLFYENYCIKKELASLKDKLNTFIKEITNG